MTEYLGRSPEYHELYDEDGILRSGSSTPVQPVAEADAPSPLTYEPGSLVENQPDDGGDDGYRAQLDAEIDAQLPGTNGNGSGDGADVIARDLLAEILTADQIEQLPPPEPLIDQLLDRDSFAVLYGQPGLGKSFVGIDIAAHVAAGQRWFGRTTHAGPVLYCAGEGVAGFGPRFAAWRDYHATIDHQGQLHVLPRAVSFLDPTAAAGLIVAAKTLEPSLVVVDTFARSLVGGDENAARDVGRAVDQCDELRRQTGACVLLVHHEGKNASVGLRGHTALLGAADTIWRLSGNTSDFLKLEAEKSKNHKTPPDVLIKLAEHDPSAVLTLRAPTAIDEGEDYDGPTRCMADLVDLFNQPTIDELTTRAVTDHLKDEGGYRAQTVREALASLAADRVLLRRNGPRKGHYYSLNPEHGLGDDVT